MKIGFHLQVGPRRWAELVAAAEESGFESVWLPEHLVMPVHMTGRPGSPHAGEPPISASTPAWDPFVQMAWLAAQTSTIRFGTNVFNIGLRHPFVTARALVTADLVSGGRVEFGIGASWLSEEWEAMELPFGTRGRRVDESIQVIRRLFSEEVVEHDGEFFHFQAVGFLPKPVHGSIRFHIGGDSSAAMRRAARLGDGWIPMAQGDPASVAAHVAEIARLRADAGRSGPFEVTLFRVPVESVDDVRRYEEAGATRLLVVPFDNPREGADALRRFGDEIIARL
ncbi:MAG TPA: TIGR03619 family F420-dependent LLM class oxidoreductase [Acidimicrobiales bacterium]|nr:TIGR03619 family F420-dependent LLM class oxidoreductase [Acidimicrobiales bacterium]